LHDNETSKLYVGEREMTADADLKLFELQSEICQTLANPKRLMILHLLKDGELAVADMIKATGLSKANLSQHLAVLRQKGVLTHRREGLTIYYKLALPRITEACGIMRDVLLDSLREKEELAKTILGTEGTRKRQKGK
jgi:ArsR family transcriptional regulator, virulence genes transcriptional regulator